MNKVTNSEKVMMDTSSKGERNIHHVDKHVGAKLREKRRELGVSQEELAKAVHLTFQQVQKYEKGLNRISCSKLHDFAKFLKTDIRYFFQGLQDMFYNTKEFASYSFGDANIGDNTDQNVEIEDLVSAFQSIKERKNRMLLLTLTQTLAWK